MNAYALRRFPEATVAAAVVVAANLVAVVPAVADINVGALACQAPFLGQAQNIRWHEHYMINPPASETTWVVCPIAFETKDLPERFFVGAFGNATVGGNALCYANVIDLRNQNIPTFNFLDNPGQDMVFQTIMSTQNPSNTLWSSWAELTRDQINAAMMSPPSTPIEPGGGVKGPAYWTITINCRLNPGQALNMVSLWPTL
jgi:hypothetical protein